MDQPIDMNDWIEKNRSNFLPPICNKLMHEEQLKVFFVGGPNARTDYHIELGEEGDMELHVMEMGKHKIIPILEGEAFLLPSRIPHSPQRFANTMGLVIERRRRSNELDGLRYYVNNSQNILYERWFHCTSLATQLQPIIRTFQESDECKTNTPSKNSRLIEAPYPDNTSIRNIDPISISNWLKRFKNEIDVSGHKALFDASPNKDDENVDTNEKKMKLSFATRVHIYGGNFKHLINNNDNNNGVHDHNNDEDGEIFLWQLISTSKIQIDNGPQWITFEPNHCLILSATSRIQLETHSDAYTLVLSMPASVESNDHLNEN